MNFFEVKSHLSKFTVGIAGVGGLGSNCAVALARSGVGTLVIVDFDVIDLPNLNRQYYFKNQVGLKKTAALEENIGNIDPEVRIISHQKKLDKSNVAEIFSGCNIIVEAFDSSEMKSMLIETVQIAMPGIPIIVGSGMAGWGNTNELTCRKIDDTLYVCGDESTEASVNMPLIAPRVGIVANMQANLVIEILMKIV